MRVLKVVKYDKFISPVTRYQGNVLGLDALVIKTMFRGNRNKEVDKVVLRTKRASR